MSPPPPDGFVHPSTEEELVALVKQAAREGRQLRVRGSAHSVPAAIGPDRDGGLFVMLDRYRRLAFDDARREVTAEAGCHLGEDPRDPTGTATEAVSLLAALEARGWALPDLGGVTHQTVSGFLSTGSSGGSVQHAIEGSVVRLRLIDGRGEVHELVRGRDDRFDAAICAMGLLGVVSSVTFRCEPRFDIVGVEKIRGEGDTEYPFFEDGGLEGFLRRTEYARVVWWPQEGVRRVVTWEARRMAQADYDARTGPPGALTPKRYSQLGEIGPLGAVKPLADAANLASQAAAGLIFDALATTKRVSDAVVSRAPSLATLRDRVRTGFARHVLPPTIRAFVPPGEQRFWEPWHRGLPMDNQMSERWLPTTFTEIWLPLERAGEAVRALRAWYDRDGYDATGPFCCEVYAAGATRGWLHPGSGRDSLRVNPFWFERNPGDPVHGWFRGYWEALAPFGYRLHWGKALPADPAFGARYLRAQYPRWDDFRALRGELDPQGIFLTRHWAAALDLEP